MMFDFNPYALLIEGAELDDDLFEIMEEYYRTGEIK